MEKWRSGLSERKKRENVSRMRKGRKEEDTDEMHEVLHEKERTA